MDRTFSKIDEMRHILHSGEGKEIDGFFVDHDAARGILSFFKDLDIEGKERFSKLTIQDMIDIVLDNSK